MARRKADEFEQLGHSERSRYAAHLDRGWHLYEKGDLVGAAASAQHAEDLTERLPDACMLAAAAAAGRGDVRGALHAYENAIERDGEYMAAYLAAAQLLSFDLNRPQATLDLLHSAEDAVHQALPADRIELELLRVEASWLLGRRDEVLDAMIELDGSDELAALREAARASHVDSHLAPAPSDKAKDQEQERRDAGHAARMVALVELFGGDDEFELEQGELPGESETQDLYARAATLVLRIARAWLDLDDPKRSLFWARGLVAFAEGEADAWHLLAEAHYRSGDALSCVHAAVQAYRLDTRDGAPSWAPGAAALHSNVQALLAECEQPRVRALVHDSPFIVLIHEAPALELVLEGVDARAPALTLSSGGRGGTQALTGVAIYRRNIARMCRGPEDFETELRAALFGELAVALALDDEDRAELGLAPAPAGQPKAN